MEITRRGELIVITLGQPICWLAQTANPWVAQLTSEVQRLTALPAHERPRGVLILQTCPATDFQAAWLRELQAEILLLELVERILKFRAMLTYIAASPVPFCYASASTCFGSHFELAMACKQRIWFDPSVSIGFPDIAKNAYPPGGTLERLARSEPKTKENWEAHPTLSAQRAAAMGLVDAATQVGDWQELARAWFSQSIAPKTAPKGSASDAAKLLVDPYQLANFGQRQGLVIRGDDRSPRSRRVYGWEYLWTLVKERGKAAVPQHHDAMAAFGAAKNLLRSDFLNELARDCSSVSRRSEIGINPLSGQPVFIDLDQFPPPAANLASLLDTKAAVVFVSAHLKSLNDGLELVYGRLEREFGAARASIYWERLVSWYQGALREDSDLILRWTVDDRLLVRWRGQTSEFLRIEGNHANARNGWLEWSHGRHEGETKQIAQRLAMILGEGVIPTKRASPKSPPVSILLRGLLLDELITAAGFTGGEIDGTLEFLRSDGWGFIAHESNWDRFLRFLPTEAPDFEALRPLRRSTVAPSLTEYPTWKHAKAAAKRLSSIEEKPWNLVTAGIHLATFSGVAAHLLRSSALLSSEEDADLLVAAVVGFPSKYGTPTSFLEGRGPARLAFYLRNNWPNVEAKELLNKGELIS